MKPEHVELHDAQIESLNVEFAKGKVAVDVLYYSEGAESSGRVPARITFTGVEAFSDVANLVALNEHRGFGNISYWTPAIGPGTTYIYLSSGCLSVTAKSVRVVKTPSHSLQGRRP